MGTNYGNHRPPQKSVYSWDDVTLREAHALYVRQDFFKTGWPEDRVREGERVYSRERRRIQRAERRAREESQISGGFDLTAPEDSP